MKQRLNYYLIKSFMGLGKILPKKMLYGLNHWLLMQFYKRKEKRRDITHENLKKGFPEKSDEVIEKMARNVYIELAKTITEVMLINASRLDIKASVLNTEEVLPRLKLLSSNAPHGIIFITAHYSNWELMCHWMALQGMPLLGVVKEGKNALIEQHIMVPFRAKYGNKSVGHNGAMLAISKSIKTGDRVIMAIDQVVQPPNGIPVTFFGHATAATKSVAMLKRKFDPLVVPIFIERVGEEQFVINLGEAIEQNSEIYTQKEEQYIDMTQCYYSVIESQIRKVPEQWLWLYNRWKRIHDAKA